MIDLSKVNKIRQLLLEWYEENPRDLPWKQTKNPYHIWLSEIILQQTRVAYGKTYYLSFIEKFPTVQDLAKASLAEVMKAWEGLGYYSRARNIHYTANEIVAKYNGIFPTTASELQKLKGIGPYTAAAIASFAFDEQVPAIDGNAYRVLSRLFSISLPIDKSKGRKMFFSYANSLLGDASAAAFNQAIMNFGATVCTPKAAKCSTCPLQYSCVSFRQNRVYDFPVKSNKIISKNRYFSAFVLRINDFVYIKERTQKDVWQNLYEFVLLEQKNPNVYQSIESFVAEHDLKEYSISSIEESIQQQLSHQRIYVDLVTIILKHKVNLPEYQLVHLQELNTFAFPKIFQKTIVQLTRYHPKKVCKTQP